MQLISSRPMILRIHEVVPYFCIWTTLMKRKQPMWIELLINVDFFRLLNEPLSYINITAHKIVITCDGHINTKQYRFPNFPHKNEINKQVEVFMKNDIIKPSNSPYNSSIWVVSKKRDSQGNKRWRMVIDFRALNEKTIGDKYTLPNITEILDQ